MLSVPACLKPTHVDFQFLVWLTKLLLGRELLSDCLHDTTVKCHVCLADVSSLLFKLLLHLQDFQIVVNLGVQFNASPSIVLAE